MFSKNIAYFPFNVNIPRYKYWILKFEFLKFKFFCILIIYDFIEKALFFKKWDSFMNLLRFFEFFGSFKKRQ